MFNAIAQLYAEKSGKSKPRIDGWTFKKDMSLLCARSMVRVPARWEQAAAGAHLQPSRQAVRPTLPDMSHTPCSRMHNVHRPISRGMYCVQVDGKSERKMLDRLGVLRKAIKEQVGKVRVKHLLPTAPVVQVEELKHLK